VRRMNLHGQAHFLGQLQLQAVVLVLGGGLVVVADFA